MIKTTTTLTITVRGRRVFLYDYPADCDKTAEQTRALAEIAVTAADNPICYWSAQVSIDEEERNLQDEANMQDFYGREP